ncbi:actin-fragmin kinase isoform X3 [Entelurus aequoreus]|uniref:actin-fragmin kinase isoform X3 n=1 Tax=Entelurus aequoreus TaxID=161455 RepID=UPI002B1D3DA5|nr:actin-fragmin kinase isoform X3 [Entelurus aequoreus]
MSQNCPCLWTEVPQASTAPCDRCKHACCAYDGYVYILGGRDNSTLRDFWRYSVAKQKWLHCQRKTSSLQTQMPTNRKGHSAVVVGSSMLMYGGFIDIKGSSQEFWSLDFDTMVWALIGGNQHGSLSPGPRHSHSAMVYQTCMYLFGGLKGLREQRDFWKWNSDSRTWSSLKTKLGPSKLFGHSAVVYKDGMLIFGGGESQNYPNNFLWRYTFSTHTWSQVNTVPGSSRSPDKMHHCCVAIGAAYASVCSEAHTRLEHGKFKPFKNKCFPAALTFLGSEGAIELQTFKLDTCPEAECGGDPAETDKIVGSCLTYENRAFSKHWSCTENELQDEDAEDISQHLPNLLLVLGGRPCAKYKPISVWQMTLGDT